MNIIDTEDYSTKLRAKSIDLENRKVLITNYQGSIQEQDLTEPANCSGFGRIRHFKLKNSDIWPINPLPIIPARKYLDISDSNEFRAQVFQNSVCNWRCWYCYVDFKLLNGDKRFSSYLSCDELLDMYLNEGNRPAIIDLSGGQPDLTPEWVPWMMETLISRNLQDEVLLWSDDNLSNDYFWRYLSPEQIEMIGSYKMYARVCCFKGIDPESFTLNTCANGNLFSNQFALFKRLWSLQIDLYGYITLTAPSTTHFEKTIPKFIDELQKIDDRIPLKVVPLEIFEFSPSHDRNNVNKRDLLVGQSIAIQVWEEEMSKRFSSSERSIPICDI